MTCKQAALMEKANIVAVDAEKIVTMAKELVTMPINFSELRLQLMYALDEHDRLVKGND